MNIKDRVKKVCPEANVYWDGGLMRITVIYQNPPNISVDSIKSRICAELSQVGLIRAVQEIRVVY